MIAALFSGQGSQYSGMGKELFDNFTSARDIYTAAADIFGFDVAKTSFEGSDEVLANTAVSQPVIFTLSIAAYTAAGEAMGEPDAVAGHSFGEFAALCCAGAFSVEDGMRIIRARARAMDGAGDAAKGAMYAIIGGSGDMVKTACDESGGFVLPVNFNLPSQTVISGEEDACAKAAEILAGNGVKAVRLGVSSAFHTSMMSEAAKVFAGEIAGIKFERSKIPFYSNLTGTRLEITDYPAYFARHMVSPVRFVEEISAMSADGITACVEFGPKKTAATLAKKNNRALSVYNIEDKDGIDGLAEFIEKVGD